LPVFFEEFAMRADTIAVIAFDDISPFHLSVPSTVFSEGRHNAGVPRYKVLVCSAEKRTFKTLSGYSITVSHGLKDLSRAGIVIVPSWRDPYEQPPEPLLKALVSAKKRGSLIVGLCLGSFVLAAAGLLDGREATTHWSWTDELAKRYPKVRVNPSVLYVDEGDIITSAGVAAGIDCCLHILRRFHGAEIASQVARRMVIPPHRQGGQAQFIEDPMPTTVEEESLANALDWAQKNIRKPLNLDCLAARAFVSRRTFTRKFRGVMGTSPSKWLLGLRLTLARRLLETTDISIGAVATDAGFSSEVALRQHFSAALKTSPSRYRKEFRGKSA
jgi:transcriptional regulator GlxA family with amidase domain